MRQDQCCSVPLLPFFSWICISLLGSSISSTERALFRSPPSFPSNCYVKIPRTCSCKELKEGEERDCFRQCLTKSLTLSVNRKQEKRDFMLISLTKHKGEK